MIESIAIFLFFVGGIILFVKMYKKNKRDALKKQKDTFDFIERVKAEIEKNNDKVLLRKIYCKIVVMRKKIIPQEKQHLENVFNQVKIKIDSLSNINYKQ